MRFVTSLCWVKRGCSKTPTRIKLEKDELKEIFVDSSKQNDYDDEDETEEDQDDEKQEETNDNEEEEQSSGNEETKIEKKYKLDDYDNEDDSIRVESLPSLACFPTNEEDNLLTLKDDGEDSDQEDLELKPTDNLVVCGTLEHEDYSLNIYVYNDIEANFYIHHDILLSAAPLCVEWFNYDLTSENSDINYVAVGTMNPEIEIWDLDVIDSLEPEFCLGSASLKKSKKKLKTDKKPKLQGHKDAVLDLCHNRLARNILASSSADKTVVLWDLDKLKQATKIKHHKQKVQSIEFHPIESFSLLSGSSDQTVALFDCRNPKSNFKTWTFDAEIERVLWNHFEPNLFLCGDSSGHVHTVDIRNDKPLYSTKVHNSSTIGLMLSSKVPNLLVTAGENAFVKIWDIKTNEMEMVFKKKLSIGSISCARNSPDNGFVYSFGGSKSSSPTIWDIRECQEVRERFYPRMNLKLEEEKDEEAEKRVLKRKERAKKFAQIVKDKKSLDANFKKSKLKQSIE